MHAAPRDCQEASHRELAVRAGDVGPFGIHFG